VTNGRLDTEIGLQTRQCPAHLQSRVDLKPQLRVFASHLHSGHQVATLYHTPVNINSRSGRTALRRDIITRCHAVYFSNQCPKRQRQREKQRVQINC
jgi:hypothetical protein